MSERGLTLIEIAIVIVLVGVVTAITFPVASAEIRRQSVRSAVNGIVSMHSKARAAAIERGRATVLELTGGRLVIRSRHPVTGLPDTVGTVEDVAQRYGVIVSATRDSVVFDGRGVGVGSVTTVIAVTKATIADTLRISPFGRVLK